MERLCCSILSRFIANSDETDVNLLFTLEVFVPISSSSSAFEATSSSSVCLTDACDCGDFNLYVPSFTLSVKYKKLHQERASKIACINDYLRKEFFVKNPCSSNSVFLLLLVKSVLYIESSSSHSQLTITWK